MTSRGAGKRQAPICGIPEREISLGDAACLMGGKLPSARILLKFPARLLLSWPMFLLESRQTIRDRAIPLVPP